MRSEHVQHSTVKYVPVLHRYVPNTSSGIAEFKTLAAGRKQICGGRFVSYDGRIISQHGVIIDKSRCKAKANGGEDHMKILGKYTEEDELYTFLSGAFLQSCNTSIVVKPTLSGSPMHLKNWMSTTTFIVDADMPKNITRSTNFTIALTRYEYANLYWTIMDLYDVFFVMKFFNKTASETSILIIDAHPKSHLDTFWFNTFGSVHRLVEMDALVQYDHLVWAISRSNSPFLVQSSVVPLVREFRETIWSRVGIPIKRPTTVCAPNVTLNILFIWRHNYIAHPRNPFGEIARKIANENEVLKGTRENFPTCNVTGVQLDNISIEQQLSLIANTDILIGMHGAALSYSVLLPQTSVVIELFPQGSSANWHMEYLAKWNGLRYIKWKNSDSKLEYKVRKMTTIPVDTVAGLIRNAQHYMCPTRKR